MGVHTHHTTDIFARFQTWERTYQYKNPHNQETSAIWLKDAMGSRLSSNTNLLPNIYSNKLLTEKHLSLLKWILVEFIVKWKQSYGQSFDITLN